MKCLKKKNCLRLLVHSFIHMLFLMCFVSSAFAADAACERRKVRVAFPSQIGMSEVGEQGDLVGYNYQYLLNLAEYAGWDLEFNTYSGMTADESIMAAMEQIMTGDVDLLGPILFSEGVADLFEFPLVNYGVVYTTLCASDKSSLSSVNYLNVSPLRVAIYTKAATRNQEVQDYLDQMGISYELIECDTTAQQLEAILNGSADLLSSITLSYFEGTRAVAQFAPRPYYLVSTKGNTALISELDQAIEKMNYTRPNLQDDLQKEFFGDTSGGFFLSDEEKRFMTDMKELDVLCITNYAPYCSRDQNGAPIGVLVSLLNDFAKDNQVQINYAFCPDAASLESQWESGEYDCVIGLPFTPQYCVQHGLIRSETVVTTNMEIYGKTSNKAYADSSVAVYGGFTDLMNLSMFREIQQYDSLDACFAAVNSGKADYGCTNQLSADYEIFENAYPFTATPLLSERLSIGIAVSLDMDSRFLSALNKYIKALPSNSITAYLSEATRHENVDAFMLFIRSQPLTVAILFASIAAAFAIIIILLWGSSKRKKWNIQLQKANAAMQEATAAKSDFLSRMSHDIRTPMNAILGFTELAKHDAASPELLQEDLNKIHSSGEFLLGLVNDVLDISKIESRAMELKPQPYPKAEFIERVQALVTPLCITKHIAFVTSFDGSIPDCFIADKLRLNQIFFNLLTNAVKFTPEHGHIRFSCRCIALDGQKARLIFAVQDDGIGMSEAFQHKMFESFTQETHHDTTIQGTGLGLPIVKSLVDLMGGSIQVESQLGQGTKFTIELPLEACPLPKPEKKSDSDSYEKVLSGKRILLVEDHPVNRQLACRLLENVGIQVTCAVNGQDGVNQFAASAVGGYDMILMDIRMPVMDGLAATKAIRALCRADAKTVPIIAMTANAFDEDVEKCREAGMTAHLSKPIKTDVLYETLSSQHF